MAEITILGAGVAGLWAARALLAHGIRPQILDRNGPPGPHGCSWWAGGMLAPQCEGAVAEPAVVIHGAAAAADWSEVTEVRHNGTLVVALDRDRAEIERFASRTTGHRFVASNEIGDLESHLGGRHRRGLFFEGEAHLAPRRALADLTTALETEGVTVQRIETKPGDLPGTVIDCRGMAAQADLPQLRAVRGEMVLLRAPEIELTRPVRLLHTRHPFYIVPRGDGLFMLGATQIESAAPGPVTARSALELLSAAYALDPRFGEAEIVEFGADLRPAFPDNVPRIVQRGRVLYLNGLYRHGYLMAPALARQAAAFIATSEKGDLFHDD